MTQRKKKQAVRSSQRRTVNFFYERLKNAFSLGERENPYFSAEKKGFSQKMFYLSSHRQLQPRLGVQIECGELAAQQLPEGGAADHRGIVGAEA